MTLNDPECPKGYPVMQLQRELTEAEMDGISKYLAGQTGFICDGFRVNPETELQERTECYEHPHGMVVFADDVKRWQKNLPVID